MRRSSALSATEELTTLDILRAAEQVRDASSERNRRVERLSLAYVGVGVSVAVASILTFLLLSVGSTGNVSQLLTAVTGMAGALVAALGGYVALYRTRQPRYELLQGGTMSLPSGEAATGWFLAQWIDLENVLREAVAKQFGESVADAPVSKLSGLLESIDVLDSKDVESLRRLLDLRNRAAHHGLSPTEADNVLPAAKDAERLGAKVRERIEDLSKRKQAP